MFRKKCSSLPSLCILLLLTSTITAFCFAVEPGKEVAESKKLDISVRERIKEVKGDETVTVVVKLTSFDLRDVNSGMAISALKAHADSSQKRVLKFLNEEKGVVVLNTFWLTNIILVNAAPATLYRLIGLDVVEKIFENFEVIITQPSNGGRVFSGDVTWGLDRIDATEAWDLGFNGSGIRVCVLDTGVENSHPDLQGKMWSDNPSDPTFPGGWVEFDSSGNLVEGSTPHDTAGHGTHTSGTVLGGNSSGVAIGVAPGAWLMHGLILPGGSGSFTQCIAGMQWAIEPFDQYGNPAGEAADVVSMSWGAQGYWDEMVEPIENMRATGVIPVASIGNGGGGTSGSPGNVYESFGIGAIDEYDAVAYFSSGEEIEWSASNPTPYIKPDFSAPGVSVYSSVPSGGWEYWSGTSMAAPHVAGTVALMLQANSGLTVDDAYDLLRITASDLGDSGLDVGYGWGVIDAYEAVSLAFSDCGVEGYILDGETSNPIEWGAQVTVTGVTWGESNTGADGYYRVWLYPGNYSVTSSSFGYYEQNSTTEVVGQLWSGLNFSLSPLSRGFIAGSVTSLGTNVTLSNASVTLVGTPLEPAMTDASGHYIIGVPVGIYDVECWRWGYKSSTTFNITVSENQTTTLDVQLEPTIRVAVLGDYKSQVADLLMRDISAQERDWDITQDIYRYDVVIVNMPSDPGEQTFLRLIESADQYRVGLVFTNTWPGPWMPYGITLLNKYMGDPEGSYYAYWSGTVYYEVTVNHPIFEGFNVGDRISLIEGGDYDYAWFYRYSGASIADIGSDSLGTLGGGVAYTVRSNGNAHILLSGLSQSSYTNIENAWTEDAKALFRQTVVWASEPLPLAPPAISVDPNSGPLSTKVRVNGSGFARNLPVTIKFDDMPIAIAEADANGSFVAVFTVPTAEYGPHDIKALDDHEAHAQTTYNITRGATIEENVLAVEVDGGPLHFRGETAEFYILTTLNGVPANATSLKATIYKPDMTEETLTAEQKATGLHHTTYTIQGDALNGTYAMKVEATLDTLYGGALHSFSVSSTLTNWNAALTAFEDGIATIQTQVGVIEMDISSLNAEVEAVQGDTAVIKTDIGEVKGDLAYVKSIVEKSNITLIAIQGETAVLKTDIGEIRGTITSVQGDTAVIKTDIGEVKGDLAYVKSIVEKSNITLIAIQGETAVLRTDIGEIQGTITSIEEDIATVETVLGQLKVALTSSRGTSDVQSNSEAGLYMLLFFSGIAVTAAVIAVVLLRGSRRAPAYLADL